jgi:peptidoglycan-associated lipoprotein
VVRARSMVIFLMVCVGFLLAGCPKKTVMMDDQSLKRAEEMAAAEGERAAKLETERKEREAKELARMKEEEARRALAEKELEAEKEMAARREAERTIKERELRFKEEAARRALDEKKREFERSLVARKYPGIEGEIFESTQFQDVYFDYNKYDIRSPDVEILQQTAVLMMEYPNVKIQIEGHSDERGTQEYNLALGERRANSVKQYLISLGVAGDRISIISYGEERPIDPGHTEEAYHKNRRAHFIILSK